MKKLLFIAAFLFAFVTHSKATLISNNTNCDVDVWVVCYDYICAGGACCISSETKYTVRAHDELNVRDCSSGCTTFLVHWRNAPCNALPAAYVARTTCTGCFAYAPVDILQGGCGCPNATVDNSVAGFLNIN